MKSHCIAGVVAIGLLATPCVVMAQTPASPTPEQAQPPTPEQAQPAVPPGEESAPAEQATCGIRTAAIYFGFDSAVLNEEGRESIAAAANHSADCRVEGVTLTGYADASGDANYNLALSQRRSEAVRHALVASGVPADAISIEAEGESQTTGDVANDRRVELRLMLTAAATTPQG
jgi:outer membrane protein OmpA-like peptidoglycan-associated protein